jgi:hypothetical protein
MTRLSLPPARFRTPELARARWAGDVTPSRWQRIVEDLRTGGSDPLYRKGMIYSFVIHLMILVIIPLLLAGWNRVENYRLPKGSGVEDPAGKAQTAAQQEMVKVQVAKPKAKPRRKYVVRSNSPIIFHVPDLDDSGLDKAIEKLTDSTYKVQGNQAMQASSGETAGGLVKGGTGKSKGRLGKGGGTQGGWPDGSENAKIRFVRLNHGGQNWDDNMNMTDRSDLNFLAAFGEFSGFKVETSKFEGYTMSQINAMDKGYKPPFLYMTGTGAINLGEAERKMLRDYIAEGGMIFADAGSPAFHNSFRAFADTLLPGNRLVAISKDDPLFQAPFNLPAGPPMLWHHGGFQCLGVKYQNRWAVFYHPGDLKDAFRTGHSGLDPAIVQSAEQTGINVITYAFTHYLEASKQYRK